MIQSEFKDWFLGFCEGSDAKIKGLTPEQIKKIMEVAESCIEEQAQYTWTSTDIGSPLYGTPITVPNTQPFTISNPSPQTLPATVKVGDFYPNQTQPIMASSNPTDIVSSIDYPTATTSDGTFVPENKSGSKRDALKMISGLIPTKKDEQPKC